MFSFSSKEKRTLEELELNVIWLKEQHKKMFARQAAFDRRLAALALEYEDETEEEGQEGENEDPRLPLDRFIKK